jgi:hypothetical protein
MFKKIETIYQKRVKTYLDGDIKHTETYRLSKYYFLFILIYSKEEVLLHNL